MIKKRTTVYLSEKLLKWLKIRSIQTNQSMSDYVNEVLYENLMEEEEDLKDIQAALNEPTISYGEVVKKLGLEDEV